MAAEALANPSEVLDLLHKKIDGDNLTVRIANNPNLVESLLELLSLLGKNLPIDDHGLIESYLKLLQELVATQRDNVLALLTQLENVNGFSRSVHTSKSIKNQQLILEIVKELKCSEKELRPLIQLPVNNKSPILNLRFEILKDLESRGSSLEELMDYILGKDIGLIHYCVLHFFYLNSADNDEKEKFIANLNYLLNLLPNPPVKDEDPSAYNKAIHKLKNHFYLEKGRIKYSQNWVNHLLALTNPGHKLYKSEAYDAVQAIMSALIKKGYIIKSIANRTQHNCRMIFKAITELNDIYQVYELLEQASNPKTSLGEFFNFNNITQPTFFVLEHYFNSVLRLQERGLPDMLVLNLLIYTNVNKEYPFLHMLCFGLAGKKSQDLTLMCVGLLTRMAKKDLSIALQVRDFLRKTSSRVDQFSEHALGLYPNDQTLLNKIIELYETVQMYKDEYPLIFVRDKASHVLDKALINNTMFAPLLLKIIKLGLISPTLTIKIAKYRGVKLTLKNALLKEASLKPKLEAITLLEEAIDSSTPLGQFFWVSRYINDASLMKGCLASINAELAKLKGNAIIASSVDHDAEETKLDKDAPTPTEVKAEFHTSFDNLLSAAVESFSAAASSVNFFRTATAEAAPEAEVELVVIDNTHFHSDEHRP
ncbi:MAG TPA: hypothetical protein VD770_05210 [Coxiellaceae bacterium]|nr:hypothetical protein [Coxiellaceae bacterium]